jgi:ABC-type glycerol-3-phosphate transport system substrate-binding protein
MLKKSLLITLVLVVLASVLVGCSGGTSYSLSGSGVRTLTPSSWKMTGSWNGHISRNYEVTADNMKTIHVESTNSDGTMILVFTQGDKELDINISDEYSGNIDLSDFEIGTVKVRLNIDNAKDINLNITWK